MERIKRLILNSFIIVLLGGTASCSQPLEELSLNGQWQFLASNNISEAEVLSADYATWDTLTVPGNWDTRERYKEFAGKGYYQRTIEIPPNWKGKQIRIKFDAVYQTSKVWLNGKPLGKHVGGYTPFEFNITNKVKAGSTYSLLVQADNTYKRGAWWNWGGIGRNVTLLCNEDLRLVYQHIEAIPDFKNDKINFTIKYKVENNAAQQQEVMITSEILAQSNTQEQIQSKFKVQANAETIHEERISANLSDYKLWHFDHPHLYKLQSNLNADGRLQDQKTDKFGVRKLEVRGEQMFLNNKAVRMNGINRVHDHPDYGNTEPDHLIQKDILDMKALGTVFSRMMHAPLATNLLDFCDSIGYLVIEEIPVWGDDDPQSFPDNPQTKQWLKEMIERDFNHPCVVGWSVGNELRDPVAPWGKKLLTPDQLGYIRSMLDYIDELDTTRLKTYVTLTADSEGANKTNEPYDKVDFISLNCYGDAIKSIDSVQKNFAGKPVFFSEIGKGQIGPAPDAVLKDELIEYLTKLKDYPSVVGVSLWCYNDYRSNYKNTPESGFREWGVVDERRNKKAAYYQLKELYGIWKEQTPFPYTVTEDTKNRELSAAMKRSFYDYETIHSADNELFSQFKYTKPEGFDYSNNDGTVSRRDPSKVIFENGKYYVWYTYRNTEVPPIGLSRADESTETIPSADWDLAEIWYATSEDGFTWEEQGVAIKRPEKPNVGWRSVSTADILKWKGKYYLYYQGFMEAIGKRGDYCSVTVSVADSPDGPWTATNEITIPNGEEGAWDQYAIHDPYPLVHDGKIYLYYKSAFNRPGNVWVCGGLAIADNPLGPFEKHPLNPVLNSGHEVTLFPFKEGVAAMVNKDGQEHNTIQYASDWVNFEIAAITELMPYAASPFMPDAFTDTKEGRGITWGMAHFINQGGKGKNHSKLVRFDCDLSRDVNDHKMKEQRVIHNPDVYYRQGLDKKQRERIARENKKLRND